MTELDRTLSLHYRSQSSVISASAKLTAVYEGLGRYAPDTPPKSRDFRKVLWYLKSCREVFEWFWEVKKRGDFWFWGGITKVSKNPKKYKSPIKLGFDREVLRPLSPELALMRRKVLPYNALYSCTQLHICEYISMPMDSSRNLKTTQVGDQLCEHQPWSK